MSDWALYFGLAAALCMVCSLAGTVLGHIWGVDPSRETPGMRAQHAARRGFCAQIACFAAVLPGSLWLGAYARETAGSVSGAMACAFAALLCALLSYGTMFASVRRDGRGMAHVCGEELSESGKKIRCALGCAACVLSAGAILMSLLRDGFVNVSNGHLFVFSCALLPMLSMQMASERMAPVIRNEKEMLPAAAGGVVCAAMIAMLMLLRGEALRLDVPIMLVISTAIILIWLASWAVLVHLGAAALHQMLERPFAMKKSRRWPKTLVCTAMSAVLALAGGAWLFTAAAALCVCCVLMDISACTAWLRRIGRGLFSRI